MKVEGTEQLRFKDILENMLEMGTSHRLKYPKGENHVIMRYSKAYQVRITKYHSDHVREDNDNGSSDSSEIKNDERFLRL